MIYQILYALFCVGFAKIQSKKILNWVDWSAGRKIKHLFNALPHLAAAVLYAIHTGEWYHGFIMLCIARLLFSTALSIFRGLPWDYVPMKPKSLIDKTEKAIFGMNGFWPKFIYFLAWVVLNNIR